MTHYASNQLPRLKNQYVDFFRTISTKVIHGSQTVRQMCSMNNITKYMFIIESFIMQTENKQITMILQTTSLQYNSQ